MTGLRVVGTGVDSLYLSARGPLWDGILPLLADLRRGAEEAGEPMVCWFREEDGAFLIRPHGWRHFLYLLNSTKMELCLGAGTHYPDAMVMMRSSFIHTVGVEAAVEAVEQILSRYVFSGPFTTSVGRIDVYADQQGWVPTIADFPNFTCRAVRRQVFEVPCRLHTSGREVSGMTFGRGDVVARVYNKTLQMRVTDTSWPELLWPDAEPGVTVWRTEFQFRSRGLRSFDLADLHDVLRRRQDLWEYGMHWLSLRAPAKHVKRSRWPEAPVCPPCL